MPVGTRAGRFAPDKAESMIEKLIGFTLIAEPYSTKTKDLGQIQAELWYYPLSPHIVKAGTPIKRTYFDHSTYTHVTVETGVVKKDRLSRPDPYGKGIKRVITVPKYDTEKFIALDEDSRRMGLAVFRSNLAHPISNPMRD